ncbi:Di-copper centre-containing protein [Rhizophagus irregularis]|uniref:Di-copper centre-containing protein n=1 Tax=Rhizophagus irregularis TaxID=588596 RepID=A0A2N0PSC8_9GLOM|nr:Di-copper centre-containing protein [Rhizophagus irregularis]
MSLAKARKGLKTEKKGGKVSPEQKILNQFLEAPKDKHKKKDKKFKFTQFDPEHADAAYNITVEFMEIANKNPENAIEKVIEYANKASETSDPELVRHALMMFVTHHPSARNKNLRIPPLIKRSPGATVPKKKNISLAPGPLVSTHSTEKIKETEDNPELYMNWYREDPNLNEHHEHWHIVYGSNGVPDVKDPKIRVHKDRHGELFVYMHRQMLARYDIERLGLGLSLIKPLDDYFAPIDEGYHPNENLVDAEDEDDPYSTFGSRKPGSKNRDYGKKDGPFTLKAMDANRKKVEEAVNCGKFYNGAEIDIDTLGAVLESYGKGDLIKYYGSLHAGGHLTIGHIIDDPGVMAQTRVAARDPVFWRWHRHIDNLVKTWEEKREPNDFSNSSPVKLQDVIFVFKDKLPIHHGETQDEEAAAFGEKTFGGKNFCTDVSKNDIVTNELETKMKTRKTDDELDDTALPIDTTPVDNNNDRFCDCGWPFHLLLPRGRKGGMKYKLLVFISDWSEDEVPTISRCGSISFCGAEGAADKYPDKKPMGYPLDRPFKNNSYKETFAGLNNAIIRDVCINWVDEFPEIVVEDSC